jgi:hypothetical protein
VAGVPLIAVEIVIGFGAPLAWALWELYSLRRDRQRQAKEAPRPEPDAAAPPPSG